MAVFRGCSSLETIELRLRSSMPDQPFQPRICVIFLTVDVGIRATADSDLVARAAAGDGAAFHALVERHRAMVYRLAYQFAGNHHDAEDIAQDVFIKVYRSLDRFRHDAQLTSWLYRIVMNACIDHNGGSRPPDGRRLRKRRN